MTPDALLIFSTFPDAGAAESAAQTLVEEKLAACVNILPAVKSIYRWQGQIEKSAEVLAIIKTARTVYPALEARLRSLHPYEVPEIVALPLHDGLPAYLNWIAASMQ